MNGAGAYQRGDRESALGTGARLLLLVSGATDLADGVRDAVVPLLAVTLTTSPVSISAVVAWQQLPFLLFGLLSGALTDRVGRRDLLLYAAVVRTGVFAFLMATTVIGALTIPCLEVSAFLLGTGAVAYDVAAAALLPELVGPRALTKANSWFSGLELIMGRFVGPSVGSVAFGAAPALPMAAAFTTNLVGVGALRKLPRDTRTPRMAGGTRLIRDIREGLRWLWHHRLLRTLVVVSTCLNFLTSTWWAILAIFTFRQLSMPERDYGFFLLVGGIGGLIGSRLAGPAERRFGSGAVLPFAVAGIAVCQALLGTTCHAVVAFLLLAAYTGLDTIWVVLSTSLRQMLVPLDLLGRVNAAYRTLGRGAAPLGTLTGGFLSTELGMRAPFLIGCPLLLAAAGLSRRALRSHGNKFSQEVCP